MPATSSKVGSYRDRCPQIEGWLLWSLVPAMEGEEVDALRDAIEAVEIATEEDDKAPEWRNSKAKEYLYGLLLRGEIPGPNDIKPRAVFDQYCKDRPEFRHFQDYRDLSFATKLRYLRAKAEERGNRSKEDAEALAHDRAIFPVPTEDTMKRPMWQGSEAQRLLRQDIENGKHKQMKPKLLYETKEEYNEVYSLDFFREKIYQEVKALKRLTWVKNKDEKAKAKKK